MDKIFTIAETFALLGEEALSIQEVNKKSRTNLQVDGFNVYRQSLRYATFYQKGTKCACCGKEGTYFKLEEDTGGRSRDTRRHFNLYAADGTLMTKDHILPKKLGGKDCVENMQTMCVDCNKNKGTHYDIELPLIVAHDMDKPENYKQFLNLEDAAFHICERIALSKGSKGGKLARKTIEIVLNILKSLETGEPAYSYMWTRETMKWEGNR